MEDSPKIARRREREKHTVSQMVALYCAAHHKHTPHDKRAYCGESLCMTCAALDAYAVKQTQHCTKMDVKTSCEKCGRHCYRPEIRREICQVMRYAGPRMLRHHPLAAIRHIIGK